MNAHSVVWNHGGISQSLSISIILTEFIMIIELKTFVFYVQIVILKPILMRGRIKYPVSLKCAGSAKWLQIFGQHVRLVCWMPEEGLTYCFKTTSQMFMKRRLLWICLSFLMRDGRNKIDKRDRKISFRRAVCMVCARWSEKPQENVRLVSLRPLQVINWRLYPLGDLYQDLPWPRATDSGQSVILRVRRLEYRTLVSFASVNDGVH